MDYSIYHLDGPNALPHLDTLLNEPSITGIQWVPGAGNAPMGSKEWLPLYKKIQKANKNVVIDSSPEYVSTLYKNLDPKGLFVRSFYRSEVISNIFLPSFMGGKDGKIIFEAVNWVREQGRSKLNRSELENFLKLKGLDFDNRIKRDLVKEINSSLSVKVFS
jgi:hypothetical protein